MRPGDLLRALDGAETIDILQFNLKSPTVVGYLFIAPRLFDNKILV